MPVHSELIRLGFVEHCKKQAAAGHKQVFPEVEIPKEGQIAAQFSRQMNRYLADIGIKTGKDIVVYSLRHTVTDRLRDAGYMDNEIEIIVGHEKRTTTAGYGVKKEGTVKRRVEMIEKIAYSGLDLSHLVEK